MVLLLPHAVSCLYNGMTFKALENWTRAKLVFEIAGWNGVLRTSIAGSSGSDSSSKFHGVFIGRGAEIRCAEFYVSREHILILISFAIAFAFAFGFD